MIKTAYLALFILLFCPTLRAEDCHKIRAAFDIGSGSTKVKVAKINICYQKIEEILYEAAQPVGYHEDLTARKTGEFSKEILSKGFQILKQLHEQTLEYKVDEFFGVATSAFRDAINGEQFLQKVHKELGIKVIIISQELEAKLGFIGASAIRTKDIKDIVVWDIGGGSMQMSTLDSDGKFIIYKGNIASVSFKEYLMKELQNKDLSKSTTPNPISTDDMKASLLTANKLAKVEIPSVIKEKIVAGAEIIGIGGVFSYSIQGQLNNAESVFNITQLSEALKLRIGMTDHEIGSKYASTEISNLILVAGFMNGLKIEKIRTGFINLADGLLIAPHFVGLN